MRIIEPEAGMLCPLDKTTLVMSERLGVEVDYCPACRGVWLDRGELDKIIERANAENDAFLQQSRPTQVTREAAPYRRGQIPSRSEYGGGDDYRHEGFRKDRKKSFLSEIFD
jgi:hypothetical protein